MIGHFVVGEESHVVCRCGNTGCLETVAGAEMIVRSRYPRRPRRAELTARRNSRLIRRNYHQRRRGCGPTRELLARRTPDRGRTRGIDQCFQSITDRSLRRPPDYKRHLSLGHPRSGLPPVAPTDNAGPPYRPIADARLIRPHWCGDSGLGQPIRNSATEFLGGSRLAAPAWPAKSPEPAVLSRQPGRTHAAK